MSEWRKVKLGDICNFVKGEIGIAKAQAGEYPLVVTGKERKTCDFFQFDTKAVCIPLVSSAGHGKAALNYVHYQEGKFALGSILVAVIPQDENIINAQFLHLYLSRLKDLLLVPLMKGTANVSLSVALIKNIEISLPKIENQIEIVSLFNQIDLDHQELIKENINQKTCLTKLRQAILQEAIEGQLTADWRVNNPVCLGDPNTDAAALLATIKAEKQKLITEGKIKKEKPLAPINPDDVPFALPDGWVWVRLGEIANLAGRIGWKGLTASEYTKEGPLFLSVHSLNYGAYVDFRDAFHISQKRYDESPEIMLQVDDILICKDGAGIGKLGVIGELPTETTINSSLLLIRRQHKINAKYLYYSLVSPFFQRIVNSRLMGATTPHLYQRDIVSFLVSLPPLAEQQAIVERVDRLLNHINALEQQVTERKHHAEQLMQAVLKEAFAG
jgi:type I restriction enzyme S subunit